MNTKSYTIRREGEVNVDRNGKATATGRGLVIVTVTDDNGQTQLDPRPSQKIRNHSPDGFDFGYAGNAPAQLALAILLDFMGKPPAPACYQAFKFYFLAPMSPEGGTIHGAQIRNWLDHWEVELKGVYQGT